MRGSARCGSPNEVVVERRRPPVSRPVWLQLGRAEDQRDRRVGDPRDEAVLSRHPREATGRPVGHVQSEPRGFATREHLDPDAMQGGKAPAGARRGRSPRRPRPRPPRTDGRGSRSSCARRRGASPDPRRLSLGRPSPAGSGRVEPLAAPCDHRARGARGTRGRRRKARSTSAVAFACPRCSAPRDSVQKLVEQSTSPSLPPQSTQHARRAAFCLVGATCGRMTYGVWKRARSSVLNRASCSASRSESTVRT
jgi:hypothetical protein